MNAQSSLSAIAAVFAAATMPFAAADEGVPDNFRTENLVAWCIVPFDAAKRGPNERAEMLKRLGLARCAYDWREEHVPTFGDEIAAYRKHGIELFAFWGEHPAAFDLFARHDLHPQVWIIPPSPEADSQDAKVAAAAAALVPAAEKTASLGCRLGLYNHGGWSGEPANLVAVCKSLREMGHGHVGIVYNFHHGHEHIADFAAALHAMQPYLLCLNLNGMADPATVAAGRDKILPIGSGAHETDMIRGVIDSGYAGPIGILDHLASQDAEVSLRRNIDGLNTLLRGIMASKEAPEDCAQARRREASAAGFALGLDSVEASLPSGSGAVAYDRSDPALRRAGFSHRDPFDRLLAAQSIEEGVAMVSPDVSLSLLGAARIW